MPPSVVTMAPYSRYWSKWVGVAADDHAGGARSAVETTEPESAVKSTSVVPVSVVFCATSTAEVNVEFTLAVALFIWMPIEPTVDMALATAERVLAPGVEVVAPWALIRTMSAASVAPWSTLDPEGAMTLVVALAELLMTPMPRPRPLRWRGVGARLRLDQERPLRVRRRSSRRLPRRWQDRSGSWSRLRLADLDSAAAVEAGLGLDDARPRSRHQGEIAKRGGGGLARAEDGEAAVVDRRLAVGLPDAIAPPAAFDPLAWAFVVVFVEVIEIPWPASIVVTTPAAGGVSLPIEADAARVTDAVGVESAPAPTPPVVPPDVVSADCVAVVVTMMLPPAFTVDPVPTDVPVAPWMVASEVRDSDRDPGEDEPWLEELAVSPDMALTPTLPVVVTSEPSPIEAVTAGFAVAEESFPAPAPRPAATAVVLAIAYRSRFAMSVRSRPWNPLAGRSERYCRSRHSSTRPGSPASAPLPPRRPRSCRLPPRRRRVASRWPRPIRHWRSVMTAPAALVLAEPI